MRFPSLLLLSTALLLVATDFHHPERAANVAHAQVSVPGRFAANLAGSFYYELSLNDLKFQMSDDDFEVGLVDLRKIQQASPPALQLPHLDNVQLLNEEEMSVRQMTEHGQEPDGAYQFGKAISVDSFSVSSSSSSSTLSQGRWVPLKVLNLQRSKVAADGGRTKPYRAVDLEDEDDVLVWQLEIHSKSALSLNLIFSDFHLPPGTEFYISGKRHTLGAFTAKVNNKADGVFATAPIAGNKLLLELYTPKSTLKEGQMPRIQLSHVVHGYKPAPLASSSEVTAKGLRQEDGTFVTRRMSRGFRDQTSEDDALRTWNHVNGYDDSDMPVQAMSGKCNIDVACHLSEYGAQSRSVGVILTDYNQKYCTGAMINNVLQDGRQLFLTANHCAGYSNTSAHVVMFNHEKTRCGSTSEIINEHDTAMGLVKLGNYAPSDYTLYEIVEEIPDAYDLYLAGWSAMPDAPSSRPRNNSPSPDPDQDEIPVSPWRTPRRKCGDKLQAQEESSEHLPTEQIPIVSIHHPSGDSKKISFVYNGSLPKTCWSSCGPEAENHWKIPHWDEGTTEPGSSGSPLFNADKRIVGQLHGGAASCYNKNGYDAYGALYDSFHTPSTTKERLATYLDPENAGTKFMDGYSLVVARRESIEQQRRPSDNDSERLRRKPTGSLGHPSLEEPNFIRERLTSAMFERLSVVFNKAWQRLVQSALEGEEEY
ncbi:hypothetical protein BGZ65_011197 [Modicella reniformis]|uniref:Serine protease n=1 Tax=Modicella reniformis TaxID=1440133 RepID=A0A9P6J5W4_9FUNG|nr:hypothetical protein BGZ65_011197 [Modicella reniformis]